MIRVNRQLTFLLFSFTFLCVFLYAVSDILLPFVLGILVAYLLDPVIDRFEARKVPRGLCSAIVLVLFYSLLGALGFLVIPLIIKQLEDLMLNMPKYLNDLNHDVLPAIKRHLRHISPVLADQLNDKAKEIRQP